MYSIEHGTDHSDVDIDRLVTVVVGIQPTAEKWDRTLAYRVLRQMADWQETWCDEAVVEPLVMTDVWYLNHQALETRPTLSIGAPRYNALTAMLTEHLPVAQAIDDRYLVQIDEDSEPIRGCTWGDGPTGNELAVDAFLDEFLDEWMNRVIEST